MEAQDSDSRRAGRTRIILGVVAALLVAVMAYAVMAGRTHPDSVTIAEEENLRGIADSVPELKDEVDAAFADGTVTREERERILTSLDTIEQVEADREALGKTSEPNR